MEPRSSDSHGSFVNPGFVVGSEPRRSVGERRRRTLEDQWGRGYQERARLDENLRDGQMIDQVNAVVTIPLSSSTSEEKNTEKETLLPN